MFSLTATYKVSKRVLMGQASRGSPTKSTSGRLGLKRVRQYKGMDSMKNGPCNLWEKERTPCT